MLSAISRAAYTAAWYALLPLVPFRLWWRGRREPGYRAHVGERFGRYARRPDGPLAWVHAVSVGETRAAAPLIETILRESPGTAVLLTHMTAAGRETGAKLFGERVAQAFLPYDVPFAVRRFLAHYRPDYGVLLETEVWPNLVAEARRREVPLFLVNARLSKRSARRYARWRSLAHPTFAGLAGVAAQAADHAARLAALGAPDPVVTGNIKFDVPIPEAQLALGAALRERWGAGRQVWVAGSTREGEEALLLAAMERAVDLPPDALLLLVPRHPQRFDEVARLLAQRGIAHVRRSGGEAVTARTRAVLGDSMGEMIAYYASADAVLIGGSLLPLGGQNLIEAMAVGRPVVVGPHMFNFAEATAEALAAGAAVQAEDAEDAIAQVAALLREPARRAAMGAAGEALWRAHRGATQRTWQWLRGCLDRGVRERPAPR